MTDVCSLEGHDRLSSTRRCDELDLETIGFVHLDNGAEIAPTQACLWQVTLQNNGVEKCEWHD